MTKHGVLIIVLADSYEHLNRCLDSLLRQDYKTIKIFVIFDENDKNILGIVERYGKLVTAKPSRKFNEATIRILDNNPLPYVSIVNTEAVFSTDWLISCVKTLTAAKDTDTVMSDLVLLDKDGRVNGVRCNFLTCDAIALADYFGHRSASLGVRRAIKKMGNPTDFFAAATLLGSRVATIPKPLCGLSENEFIERRIQPKIISHYFLKAPMNLFVNSAARHKLAGEDWEQTYVLLYSIFILELIKKCRFLGASKMFIMATRVPGYRKSIIRNVFYRHNDLRKRLDAVGLEANR